MAPRTAREATLAGLLAEVLGLPAVGVDDDVFRLGGDSISAIQLVTRARDAGLVLSARDVFAERTVARLAAVARDLASRAEAPGAGIGPVAPTPALAAWLEGSVPARSALGAAEAGGPASGGVPRPGRPRSRCRRRDPPTPLDRRPTRPAGRLAWPAPLPTRPPGPPTRPTAGFGWRLLAAPDGLDRPTLVALVGDLLDRHDALRARLVMPEAGAEPATARLEVRPPGAVDVEALVTVVDGPVDDRVLAAERDAAAARLNPAAGVVVQVVWCASGPGAAGPGSVLVVASGLVADRASWDVLVADLRALAAGHDVARPPVSLRTWAAGLAGTPGAGAADRWLDLLERPALPALGSHAAGGRPEAGRHRATAEAVVPAHVAESLAAVASACHATVDDVVATALAVALGEGPAPASAPAAGEAAVLLDLDGDARLAAPGDTLGRTVGALTVPVPVALAPGAGSRVAQLKAVKEQLRAAARSAGEYGALRHLDDHAGPLLAGAPAPAVRVTGLRLAPADEARPDGPAGWDVRGGADAPVPGAPGRPLTVAVTLGDEVRLTWSAADGVVEGGLVRRLAARCEAVLGELAALAGDGRAGGRTPSDLPLAALDQAELDRIEAAVPELVDVLPLTPLQEGLAFHAAARAPGEPDPYVVQHTLGLVGPGRRRAPPGRGRRAARPPPPPAGPVPADGGRPVPAGRARGRRGGVAGRRPRRPRPRRAGPADRPGGGRRARPGDRPGRRPAGPLRPAAPRRRVPPGPHVPPRGGRRVVGAADPPRPAGPAHRGRGGRRPAAGPPLPRPPRLAGDPRRRRRP